MPTYDYVCDACGHAFEHFQSISEDVLVACPSCRKRRLRRLIGSGAGILFKGSGFYETDYKRAGETSPAKGDGEGDKVKDRKGEDGEGKGGRTGGDAGAAGKPDGGAPASGPKPPARDEPSSGGGTSKPGDGARKG